jgi:NADH-quinone oxidoreductase subunit M
MLDPQRLWDTLLENAVFMLLVLPLVGAGLALLSRPCGIDAVRRTALTNVLLSFALSLLMLFHYDPAAKIDGRTQHFQMVSRLRWIAEEKLEVVDPEAEPPAMRRVLRGPNVQLAVGVDGVSLWFVALTSTLMVAAVVAGASADQRRPELFYALLLIAESAAIAVFAALDVIVFVAGLEILALSVFLLIGLWGGGERRAAARRLYLFSLAGSLLIALGLVALVIAHAWMLRFTIGSAASGAFQFNAAELVHGAGGAPSLAALASSPDARPCWDGFAPGIFAALLTGFAIRLAAFPFHAWMRPAITEAPTSAALLVTGPLVLAGGYGWARFVVPLFAPQCLALSGILAGLAAFAAVCFGLIAVVSRDGKDRVTCAGLTVFSVWAAAIFSLNAAALAGGILLVLGASLALAILQVVLGVLDERRTIAGAEPSSPAPAHFPRVAFWFAIGGLALTGAPGTSGFSGGMIAILGIFRGNTASNARLGAAFWCLVAGLLVLWSLSKAWEQAFRAPDRPRSAVRDLTAAEVASLLPLAAAILWMGLWPQFFVSRMQPSLREILSPYETTAAPSPEAAE